VWLAGYSEQSSVKFIPDDVMNPDMEAFKLHGISRMYKAAIAVILAMTD